MNACQSLFSQWTKSLFLTARNLLWCTTVFSPFVTWSGNQSPVVPSFCTETTAVRRLVAIHTRKTITDTNTLTRPDFDKTLHSLFSRRFLNTNEQMFPYIRLCRQHVVSTQNHLVLSAVSFLRRLYVAQTFRSDARALRYVRLNNWLTYEHNFSSLPGPNNGRRSIVVMGFHLLPEIAESKTCSCDSLTPPPFYNQFYS